MEWAISDRAAHSPDAASQVAAKRPTADAVPERAAPGEVALLPPVPGRLDPRAKPPRNPAAILTMQRSVGNAVVQRLLITPPVRRTCACGGTPGPDGLCDACRAAGAGREEQGANREPAGTIARVSDEASPRPTPTVIARAAAPALQRAPKHDDETPGTPKAPPPPAPQANTPTTAADQTPAPGSAAQPTTAPPPPSGGGMPGGGNGQASGGGQMNSAPLQITTAAPGPAGPGGASVPGTVAPEAGTGEPGSTPDAGKVVGAAAATTTEGLLATLGNLPVSGLGSALGFAQQTATALMTKEKEEAAASVPAIAQPTGLPTGAEPEKPTLPGQPPQSTATPTAGNRAKQPPDTRHPEPSAPLPATNLPTTVGKPPEDEGGLLAWIGTKVQGLLGSLPTHDPGVSTSAGSRPHIDLTGDANPALAARHGQEAEHELAGQRAHADAITNTDFGETGIKPTVAVETLRPTEQPTPPPAPHLAGPLDTPALPADERAKFDQATGPLVHEPIHAELAKYKEERGKYDQTAKDAQATGKQQLAEETGRAKLEQETLRKQAHADISAEKGRWRDENLKVERDFGSKASAKRAELDKQIEGKVQATHAEADAKLTEAEGKARAEQAKAEAEAAAKKQEEENKPKSFWEKAKDAVSDVFNAIKGAINAIFDKMRALVKTIIETAKSAVSALIEAARSAIVGMLQQFGEVLKGLVGVALAAFPEIAKKFQSAIDAKIKEAVSAVNRAADKLKKAATAILDFVGKAIDTALSIVQKAFIAALSVIEALAKAPFAVMDALAKLIAWLKKNKNILDIFKKMEQEGDTVLEQIKTKVGAMIEGVPAAAQAKLKELTAPLAGKGAVPATATATAGGAKAPAPGAPIQRAPAAVPAAVPAPAAKKTPKDASDHLLGIGNALDKGLTHLKEHWWDELKKVGWNLLWPWPAVWSDIKEIWANIKAGYQAAYQLKFGKVIDAVLANEQKINSILGNLYGWFFIASVLVGALFAGVGAAAGAAFAGTVGEALALAVIGTETAIILKAIADLVIGNDTDAEDTEDYGKIGGGILTITITAILFILGAAAAKFASAIWDGVAGLFKGEKPPEVGVKVEGDGKAGGDAKPGDAKAGDDSLGTEGGKKVLAQETGPDGETIKVEEDGTCVICRACANFREQMEADFRTELDDPANSDIKDALKQAEGIADPAAKAKAEANILARLKKAQAQNLTAKTQWGFRRSPAWRAAVREVATPGTHETVQGNVPSRKEGLMLIEDANGTVERIDAPHEPPNPHSYPHINYTTASGAKGTIKIQGL